jgi:hypothetical protein
MSDPGKTSTARLMTIWVLAMAPFSLAGSLIQSATSRMGRGRSSAAQFATLSLTLFVCGILAGAVQAWILARRRAPVRRWTLAVGLGSLAGTALAWGTSLQMLRVAQSQGLLSSVAFSWFYSLFWAGTIALCMAVAQALALWGRRWTSDAFVWIAGILALRVLPMLALRLLSAELMQGPYPLSNLSFTVVQGAIVAAGTAWLLDRLYFRDPATAWAD